MRRSLFSRVIALFLGLWFLAVTAVPEVTHACPLHGAHSGVATQADAHSAHAGSHGDVVGRDQSAPAQRDQCTCLGQCCSTAPVALISATVSLADVVTAATHDAGLPDYDYVRVVFEHVLPLAQAPPLSA